MNKKKIALLSCDNLDGYVVDDHFLAQELEKEYSVETVSWSANEDWGRFKAVIIRSTWDYVERYAEFLEALKKIQTSGAKLFNSYSVINWNIHKFYLRELSARGIRIVPTLFLEERDELMIPEEWSADKFILKPAISATAYKTSVIDRNTKIDRGPGEWLLQPFVETILQGEFSLVYFDGKFSHGIKKVPKSGDFRVQEEFGGAITAFEPTPEMKKFAETVIDRVDFPILYARVDLVPYEDSFALMELELIEPSLYFRTTSEGARNFHLALRNYV